MGGDVIKLWRRSTSRQSSSPKNSVSLACLLSAGLLFFVVILVDQCDSQLNPEHRGDPDGGINLNEYEDDDGSDGSVVPILAHRQGIQHEDVLTALPNHYYLPNSGQYNGPVYSPGSNGTGDGNGNNNNSAPQGTSATPSESTVGPGQKDFTPPNDIVRGFKPVYPDDARFVSITTTTVVPPKRRKKVKRVKPGQQSQQQQQAANQSQTAQQQQAPVKGATSATSFQNQQQGFQNSFGFQPTGNGGPYFHPYAHQGQSGPGSGPYFANYGYPGGNSMNETQSGLVSFPNDTSSTAAAAVPPNYSTLYSTSQQGVQSGQEQYQQQQQQQVGPYLSSGVSLAGAPGFPPGPPPGHAPHGPHGPHKMNPLKKLANFIRGRPRPHHPMGHPPMQPHHGGPHGPHGQGPQGQFALQAGSNPHQSVMPPQYQGQQPGHHPGQQHRHPHHPSHYNGQSIPQQQHYQQLRQQQQQQASSQNLTQTEGNNNSNSTNASASNTVPVNYPNQGHPGYPGQLPPGQMLGPHGMPQRPGPPNKNFLSKLSFNTYLKKFSNMFQRGPPTPGVPLGLPPQGGKVPPQQNGVAHGPPHGPPPQQKVPQQILYPHYYPLNSYAPNGPNAQAQAHYQQQQQQFLQQQQQQQQHEQIGQEGGIVSGVVPPNNQIRRRRIKIRNRNKNMDPRNRKVDGVVGEGGNEEEQKELIGRPRLAGQNDETVDEDVIMSNENKPEEDENAGGKRRRKRLATISGIAINTTSSSSGSIGSEPPSHSSSGYRMPGIFGMDSGKAFYLEKDPQTGDVTFNAPAASAESSAQAHSSPASNEVSPENKTKPVIIHSYSHTKNQGGLSTYKRPNLSSLNNKFKAKRPTFYRFNKTSTLAPPRLPSFYVPSSTRFPTSSSSTTTPPPSTTVITAGSSSPRTEFPNVIVAQKSSEVITRVSISTSKEISGGPQYKISTSKEISGPQYKKKSPPVKFPLFKYTTISTTSTTSEATPPQTEAASNAPSETPSEPVTKSVETTTTPQVETSFFSTSSPKSTTMEASSTTALFFDPYLPIELLNLQKQALATASPPTSTEPSTTLQPTSSPSPTTTTQASTSTTTTEKSTTTTTEVTTPFTTTTTIDPYTVPNVVQTSSSLPSTEPPPTEPSLQTPASSAPPAVSSSQSPPSSSPSPDASTGSNGSSLLPTGPEAESPDNSQELEEEEDYYYDSPDPNQSYPQNPNSFNSFGQFGPGAGMPPPGYFNPMMPNGGRPPVGPPGNYYNSFNPFGSPGYYPAPPPPGQQNNMQGGYYNPVGEFIPSHGIPPSAIPPTPETPSSSSIASEATPTQPAEAAAPTQQSEATTPEQTTVTTTVPTTTMTPSTTTTTQKTTTTTVSTTKPTTTTTPAPAPPPEDDLLLLGDPDTEVYEYEEEIEGDSAVLPTQQQTQQQPPQSSFHLPPPPPQRPQPPIPPHRRPPPPPPFHHHRVPPMYFNNQRPPPVRAGGNFPFRPPPPVKELLRPSGSPSPTPAKTSEPAVTTVSTTPSTTTPPPPPPPPSTTTTTTPPPPTTITTTVPPTTSTTTPPPPTTISTTTTTTPPPTTTTTTTTEPPTTPYHPPAEESVPPESREAVNQDLFIPPEQLLAYTPSPDRVRDRIPDEVIQDIAPGFDLFNVQWGQKVPPPSSTSYSSQEQQPYPVQHLSTTTQPPATTRIISRNVTEVNINGTDYIYEYIDEIIEEDAPQNLTETSSTSQNAAILSEHPNVQNQQLPEGIPPQQYYNPYLINPYEAFIPMSSTPGPFVPGGAFVMPNGGAPWIPPQAGQQYMNGYYLPPGVYPNQYPVQGIEGSQQFIPVGAQFNPSSPVPPQPEIINVSPSATPTPTTEPVVSNGDNNNIQFSSPSGQLALGSSSHEVLAESPSSVLPPLSPVTENSVDNVETSPSSPSTEPSLPPEVVQDVHPQNDDLSESYIVSLIDPSRENGTAVSPFAGLAGFVSSTGQPHISLFENEDAANNNLLIGSTAGTPSSVQPVEQHEIHISSTPQISTTTTPTTTTSDKSVSYEYVDYPEEPVEGENVNAAPVNIQSNAPPASQAPVTFEQQQQLQNIQNLQMMRPPAPLPPHMQQHGGQSSGMTGSHLKKKPSSFLQNLFGKLRHPGGPPPPHGHFQHGLPPPSRPGSPGDNLTSGSNRIPQINGNHPGLPLLPPVMIPNAQMDPNHFNMDTLFGARNGTAAEADPPMVPSAPPSTTTTTTTSTTTEVSTTTSTPSTTPPPPQPSGPSSAELGSEEEDEVIYVTPEELAKLKETGQVDDFELVEDEEEYEYEDEPFNDITDNKLARSDHKMLLLGENDTESSLLKKTAPIASAASSPVEIPPTQTTTQATTYPSTRGPPQAQERKQEMPGQQQNQESFAPQSSQTPATIPSLGMFQMKPPSDFGRLPAPPIPPHHGMMPPPPHGHHPHMHHHHQGRIPVPPHIPPPHPQAYRHPPQQYSTLPHAPPPPPPSHSPNLGHSHYNANNGQPGPPPPQHFFNPVPSSSSPAQTSIPLTSSSGLSPIADKRQDTFAPKYDYDDSIELITAGPLLDPSIPRDIVVKSSFNTAGNAPKPKSLEAVAPSPISSSAASSQQQGQWKSVVEKVSTFERRSGMSYAHPSSQSSSSHHHNSQSLSNPARSLPNHYDKNAHLQQFQQQHHQSASSQFSRGIRQMSNDGSNGKHSSSNNSNNNHSPSSNQHYWGPGI